uniref:TSA: Wollemia nobilis Ref_Wollemi_Transcript_10095_1329 transcribed RNA sequence n=1 Tax=Wollemia nobilis TaxID=56998 RepID=A0A0C9RVZ0_9CONI
MESIVKNREVVLVSYFEGGPVTEHHLTIRETQMDINGCKEGEVAVQNLWIAVDPYIRWLMESPDRSIYFQNYELNQPITSDVVGKVVASAYLGLEVGDMVTGIYQVSEYSIVAGSSLKKLDTRFVKPSYYLGPLGMGGLTAWLGMVLIGNPKPGEEVFVSAAAGAVGLLAAQLAKSKGCRVVGSVGSEEKVKVLREEFGLDDAFNYKSETDWNAALSKYFPRGIDIYFDNVGGGMLEAALNHMKMNARISLCGMISQYNMKDWKESYGVKNLMNLLLKCAKMQGFLVTEYWNYRDEFMEEVRGYMKEGKIKYREDVKQGLDSFCEALNAVYSGGNIGKAIVQVRHP